MEVGLLGLGLAYALNLMGLFQYSVRQSAEVENQVRYGILSTSYNYPASFMQ